MQSVINKQWAVVHLGTLWVDKKVFCPLWPLIGWPNLCRPNWSNMLKCNTNHQQKKQLKMSTVTFRAEDDTPSVTGKTWWTSEAKWTHSFGCCHFKGARRLQRQTTFQWALSQSWGCDGGAHCCAWLSPASSHHLTHLDQTLSAVQGVTEALQQETSPLLVDQLEQRWEQMIKLNSSALTLCNLQLFSSSKTFIIS